MDWSINCFFVVSYSFSGECFIVEVCDSGFLERQRNISFDITSPLFSLSFGSPLKEFCFVGGV